MSINDADSAINVMSGALRRALCVSDGVTDSECDKVIALDATCTVPVATDSDCKELVS